MVDTMAVATQVEVRVLLLLAAVAAAHQIYELAVTLLVIEYLLAQVEVVPAAIVSAAVVEVQVAEEEQDTTAAEAVLLGRAEHPELIRTVVASLQAVQAEFLLTLQRHRQITGAQGH
jgi:hypothetical protein